MNTGIDAGAPGHKLRARLLELGWVPPSPELEAWSKLAKFGAAVLKAHRADGACDLDGGQLEHMAEAAGVLELRQMSEPCGPNCACVAIGGVDEFPAPCLFMPDTIAAIVNHQE